MKLEIKQIVKNYIESYKNKNLILSSIDHKNVFDVKTQNQIIKHYVNLTDPETFSVVLTIGVPEKSIKLLESMMFKEVKLSDFTNLNYGSHRQTNYDLHIWITAEDYKFYTSANASI